MRDAIVVGSSAGGIHALRGLVHGLPKDLPAAVVVVNHIPSAALSALPMILGSAGPLSAKAAEDGEAMNRGTVYVAPPDRHVLIEKGRLRLTNGPRENRVRPCVDTLFRSAAVDLGPRVIGVVLSGALDDGTAGLWAIKDRGGIAIVQNPSEAEYPDMPESAIAHVAIDHVLPVAEMGPRLGALVRERINAEAAPPRPAMAAETQMDLRGRALSKGVLELGRSSQNSCPACHGSLVEIREGSIARYRCHTGHAYSLRTLLEETDLAIESSLWNTVRALEERSFLLRTLEGQAREKDDRELGERLAAAAERDETSAQGVRALSVGPSAVR